MTLGHNVPLPWDGCAHALGISTSMLTAEARSDDGSAACRRCCPIGDNGLNDERVGNVGKAFVVNLLCNPALSAVDGVAVEDNWEPIGRIGEE